MTSIYQELRETLGAKMELDHSSFFDDMDVGISGERGNLKSFCDKLGLSYNGQNQFVGDR